jgi:hypothetical protein
VSVKRSALVALLILVLPASAAAKPRWSAPLRIDATPHENHAPVIDYASLAGNARGDRLVIWRANEGVMYSFFRRGGRFGKARLIDSPWTPTEFMQAALDAKGRAVVAWTAFDDERAGEGHGDFGCCERLFAAVVRPGARAPHAKRLTRAGSDAEAPHLAVSPGGRAGLVWSYPERLYARFGTTRRGFGKPEPVAEGIARGLVLGGQRPRVAVVEGFPGQVVEYTRRSAGLYERGAARPVDMLSFGSDARGREVLLNQEQDSDFTGLLEVATRAPGDDLEWRMLAHDNPAWYEPQLDVAPSGAAAVAWSETGGNSVSAAIGGTSGGFRSPRVVYTAPPGREGIPPLFLADVAAAPRGGGAIGVLTDAAPNRPRVVLLGRRGRVSADHAIRSNEVARELHVVSDTRGTAAVWATDQGLFVSTTR